MSINIGHGIFRYQTRSAGLTFFKLTYDKVRENVQYICIIIIIIIMLILICGGMLMCGI